jgi:hypothetical protein
MQAPGGPPGARLPMPGAPLPHPAPSVRPAAGGPMAPAGRGPLDVMAPTQVTEKKVRLVIDDSAVKDSEIGRRGSTVAVITLAVGAALGLFIGYGIGNTKDQNSQFNMAVRDGKEIYLKINEVSKKLETAQAAVRSAMEASQGGPGKQAKADYKSIEALVAMERPFSAGEFSRRRYLAFPTNVVDDLFEYYNNINLLWDKFAAIGAKTSGQHARESLDKSAAAADELIASEYGMVVSKAGDDYAGGIVVVRRKPADEVEAADAKKDKKKGKDAKEEDASVIMMVSSREGGQEVERKLFQGQSDYLEKSGDYVISVDKAKSMKTLGGGATLFGQYRSDIGEINGLMVKTAEIQGRLIKSLGEINNMQERGFLGM